LPGNGGLYYQSIFDLMSHPKNESLKSLLLLCIMVLSACAQKHEKNNSGSYTGLNAVDSTLVFEHKGISDLRKGDILVKPNVNLLPGSAFIEGGWGYGHAALVTNGAQHAHPDSLLAGSFIFESHARPVHRIHQLREVPAYQISEDPVLHNDNFGPQYTGNRYRLRLNIPESQIDSIIAFVRSQKGSYSSWNAMKRFPDIPHIEALIQDGKRENWADNSHWYCSLLVWQAVLFVTGIDLDPNGGYYVYPNDLIASPYFINTADFKGRTRF
jgi:hypothetical protein